MYPFAKIEKKWQKAWAESDIYKACDFSKKPKYYALVEFPYPSGDGLHTGHIRSYTAADIIARKKRMEGHNVLYPIGWDAFGLPTENYAIKTGTHPKIVTKKNTDTFRRQLKSLGFSFDWSREINTTNPDYYKWTQWIFLQFYKKGLAYKKKMPINWCQSCKIGLANEEVVAGHCERCGAAAEQREREQWLLAITKYADRLLNDLKTVDYLDKIKIQQINWIGKSEGALIKFQILSLRDVSRRETNSVPAGHLPKGDKFCPCGMSPEGRQNPKAENFIEVFTTRPDTLFGATYMVLAPEHPLIKNLEFRIKNLGEVKSYIEQARKKSDLQRTDLINEKTGIELKGIKAINPANNEKIPIFAADYVLASYGTGAIMAVPAHDERDFEFAKKFHLPMRSVIEREGKSAEADFEKAYVGDGLLINSNKFSGMPSNQAKLAITKFVNGESKTQFHLRDWIFSRQHYWGEPIPLVFCESCKKRVENSKFQIPNSKQIQNSKFKIQNLEFSLGEILNPGWIAVPEKDLPVRLPEVKKYQPTDTGESPLASIKNWVNTKCPACKGPARRETDTMPNWAGSSWYFLRYTDVKNRKTLADPKKLKYWMAVDWYNGGMEHTTLHLLYSRFWNKFLYDIGASPVSEAYKKRTSQGMVLGGGGEKMSKSKGNVVNPDSIVKAFGADVLRLYEMFMGPFDQAIPWDEKGLNGCSRFLGRIWETAHKKKFAGKSNFSGKSFEAAINKTIKKVGEDIESMNFNTAVSALMIFSNECYKAEKISLEAWEKFLVILSPFAPHITEELWYELGHTKSIHREKWPVYEPKLVKEEKFELIIQVNGKLRGKVTVHWGMEEKEAREAALTIPAVSSHINGKEIKKVIFVPDRLINFVI